MIDKPKHCPVEWNEMVPARGGRKCLKCEKYIKDFSKNSWESIEKIQSSEEGPYCGIFTKKQIENWGVDQKSLGISQSRKLKKMAMFSSIFLSISGAKGESLNPEMTKYSHGINPIEWQSNEVSKALSEKGAKLLIKGMIVDKENQQPLIGATIQNEELRIGALTDEEGRFKLTLTNPELIQLPLRLKVSYVGYLDEWIEISDWTNEEFLVEVVMDKVEISVFYIRRPPFHKRVWWKLKSMFR